MYVKDVVLWRARQCGTMVDVSQVMIVHTITCQIHSSRHTTPLRNELSCSCNCTEILDLFTMKMELLSPLLSDSPFLSSKVFCFFRFWNLTVEWTKWNHACWGPRELSILNSFLVFPRPVNFALSETRQFCSILVLASFLRIKSSITTITVIELFIPEKSEGHVQKVGLDFWVFTQQNQMESVCFREQRKKMFGGEKWRVTGEEVKVPVS